LSDQKIRIRVRKNRIFEIAAVLTISLQTGCLPVCVPACASHADRRTRTGRWHTKKAEIAALGRSDERTEIIDKQVISLNQRAVSNAKTSENHSVCL